jgi:hypothetical protein
VFFIIYINFIFREAEEGKKKKEKKNKLGLFLRRSSSSPRSGLSPPSSPKMNRHSVSVENLYNIPHSPLSPPLSRVSSVESVCGNTGGEGIYIHKSIFWSTHTHARSTKCQAEIRSLRRFFPLTLTRTHFHSLSLLTLTCTHSHYSHSTCVHCSYTHALPGRRNSQASRRYVSAVRRQADSKGTRRILVPRKIPFVCYVRRISQKRYIIFTYPRLVFPLTSLSHFSVVFFIFIYLFVK